MIRVRVPLDLHAVAATGSVAFALATPLRLRKLLELVVREAIGARAPEEKFERSLRSTLVGLRHGDFTCTVNGRIVRDADEVVVCDGTADICFYLAEARL